MYHSLTDLAVSLPTKPSSDDYSAFRRGFGAEASLPLIHSTLTVTHDNTRLCWNDVTLWVFHIHADAVKALFWIFYKYFLLSDGESPRLVKNTEVELVMKPQHLTSIGSTVVIQSFLTHCSRISSYFSNLHLCAQWKFSWKGTVNSITKTFFFILTDRMEAGS